MFSSAKKAISGNGAASRGMPSIVSAELHITGDLACKGDLLIEGAIDGNIKCQSITVGEAATIAGEIVCDTARICGRIKGRVTGKSVTLTATARVIGDIVHETIAIEPGAYFEGQLRHHATPALEAPDGRELVEAVREIAARAESAQPAAGRAELDYRTLSVHAPKPAREHKAERAARAATAAAVPDPTPNGKAGTH